MAHNEINNRLAIYIKNIYDDKRPDASNQDNFEGLSMLASEVEDALQHMKKGKAYGLDKW